MTGSGCEEWLLEPGMLRLWKAIGGFYAIHGAVLGTSPGAIYTSTNI